MRGIVLNDVAGDQPIEQHTDSGKMLRAVELYRGELMPGFHLPDCAEFERWLDEERALARERAAASAWGLARSLESDSRLTDAGRMARRAVRYSWDDERVLRRTITMLARIGDHAGALRLYEEFAARMKQELDADPSPETVALVDSRLAGRRAQLRFASLSAWQRSTSYSKS